jgi:DNA segregation ATPase FtsK/SpoIIIE, S-DNA-T family
VLGLEGALPAQLKFDDQTPHWLVGGPTGSGKTVFLIDLLYGLACRYSPQELSLYLLDFKEGVSFTEFTPRAHEPDCHPDCTLHDPTWIPHARVVGIESDRQYGVAVLRSLVAEMNKRGNEMKRVGVQNLASLRAQRPGTPYPRIVTVIDEFQHMFAGNDGLTGQTVVLLEELARKGRSYGIHLVLASQTAAGIQALYDKKESIFGQFGMRIALRGSRTVLDPENFHDDNLPLGSMVVNAAAGHKDANRVVQFPDATSDPGRLHDIRQRLWAQRTDDNPPAVFAGYARQQLADDPAYRSASPGAARPVAMVGRFIDVGLPTAGFPLDPTVGRHVAILGTKTDCAHILQAAATSLAGQHAPESARFVLAPFVNPELAEQAREQLAEHGHEADVVDLPAFRRVVHELATDTTAARARTYLVTYGIDAVSAALENVDEHGNNTGDQLRQLFRDGPGRGVHILGWWRGYTRFTATVVGQYGVGAHHEVACVVAVNTAASELSPYFGGMPPDWTPSDNRAYFIDTGETRTGIIVPFTPADDD